MFFSKKFWKGLFGPDEFTKHANRVMEKATFTIDQFDTQVRRYTMGDGSVHFRAFLVGAFDTEYALHCTRTLGPAYCVPPLYSSHGNIGSIARFNSYEDARDAADEMCVKVNRKLKEERVLKIENV